MVRAFTLLESLVVLGITSFVILLFSGGLAGTVHLIKGELFVLEFERAYQRAQADAGLMGQAEVLAVKNQVLICENEKIDLPKEVRCQDFRVVFNGAGENSTLQKLVLTLPYEKQTVIYQMEMGSGKYRKVVEDCGK